MAIVLQVVFLALGFLMLIKGSDWFVDGAAGIAGKLGVPELVIGLTIVAMGTSAPEAAVSISAALKGSADITIGNVLGSNILNILIILGLASVITVVPVQKSTVYYEIPFMIFVTVAMLILAYTNNELAFLEGIVIWGLFIAYLVYLYYMSKAGSSEGESKQRPVWQLVILTLVGVGLIVWGSDVTVDAATSIAKIMGISDRIIALTIVALGTSLPELFTSVSAARKGNAGIAVGNIVGSNIFNVLFVVGTTALITPVQFAPDFIQDAIVAILSSVLLWCLVFRSRKLDRKAGFILLACYAAYFVYTVIIV